METPPYPTAESLAIDRLADTLRDVLSPSTVYRHVPETLDPASAPWPVLTVGNLRRLLEHADPNMLVYADGAGRVAGFVRTAEATIKLLTVNHG